ncbi:hypothetical protein [Rhizobium sp. 22-785-1]
MANDMWLQLNGAKLGMYTWDLSRNSLVGDEYYSYLYGFDPDKLAAGIDIETLLSKILQEDREIVAERTHASILDGLFGTISFRVTRRSGLLRLGAFGRCIKDVDGTPNFFTGAVFELGSDNPRFSYRSPTSFQ